MEKEKKLKNLNNDEKPAKRPNIRASEDVDDLIFEEEGYKCSEK